MGSRACGLQLFWCTGLAILQYVGSPWNGDRTHVPFIGRQILNHWTTREVPAIGFLERGHRCLPDPFCSIYQPVPHPCLCLTHPFPEAQQGLTCAAVSRCFNQWPYSPRPLLLSGLWTGMTWGFTDSQDCGGGGVIG